MPPSWIEPQTGVSPDALESEIYFLEWLLECPEIAPRVALVEGRWQAVVVEIEVRAEVQRAAR